MFKMADMIGIRGTETFWLETGQMKPEQLDLLEVRGITTLSDTEFWKNW